MGIRRILLVTTSGEVHKIPLMYEPARPCDHHWEWIDNRTIQCHRCGAITSDDRNTR